MRVSFVIGAATTRYTGHMWRDQRVRPPRDREPRHRGQVSHGSPGSAVSRSFPSVITEPSRSGGTRRDLVGDDDHAAVGAERPDLVHDEPEHRIVGIDELGHEQE